MSLIDQTVSSQTKSLWHQRAFLLLWIASSPGSLARFVVRLALPLVAIWLTTSPLLVSGVTFALAVPWLLFGLPAGVLADRFDHQHVLLWAAALGLGVCVLLAGAALFGLLSLPALSAAALLLGISETLTETATTAFTPPCSYPTSSLNRSICACWACKRRHVSSFFIFFSNRSKERMFHGQHNPPQSPSALDDVGPDVYRYRHAGRAAGGLADPTGEQYTRLA